MTAVRRHIIICEGESERAYLQRLQSFLGEQPLAADAVEQPVLFIGVPKKPGAAGGGHYHGVVKVYREETRGLRGKPAHIWLDADIYIRNERNNREKLMAACSRQRPDFLFSHYVFEDFLAMHLDDSRFGRWQDLFEKSGHFSSPLRSADYLAEFKRIIPSYRKGDIPLDLISWTALDNLRRHSAALKPRLTLLAGQKWFSDFLIDELSAAYPASPLNNLPL